MIKRIKAAWLAFRDPELVEIKDELTGALTRKTFFRVANRELARTKRQQQQLSLVFLDLDNLKNINDMRGHKAGDIHLRKCAQVVMKHIRPYDILARIGGDEFVLLLPGATGDEAEMIIRRIYNLFPEFSWGISSWFEGANLESLLEKADTGMYRVKEKKK